MATEVTRYPRWPPRSSVIQDGRRGITWFCFSIWPPWFYETTGKQNGRCGHVVIVAIQYGRRCHVRCKRMWRWPLESHDICHESIWRLTLCVVRIFDAKYLIGGFYCVSQRLSLLFVTTINIVIDIKRHADLDVIDDFCILFFLARIFYLFIYCLLVCLLYFVLFVLFFYFVYFFVLDSQLGRIKPS